MYRWTMVFPLYLAYVYSQFCSLLFGYYSYYRNGVGYAVGYHVLVEAKGNTDISDIVEFPVALGTVPPASGVDSGRVKLAGRTLEYEIPKGMPRGTNQT
jgi:hypothetical protein